MKIGKKIQLMCVLLVLFVVTVLSITVGVQSGIMNRTLSYEIVNTADKTLESIVINLYSMCVAQNEMISEKVKTDLNVARSIVNSYGDVQFNELETVSWSAINQYSKKSTPVELPKMMIGSEWLGKNSSFSVSSPVVDTVQSLVDGTCTIFQRMNDAGDMLRVCTNVKKLDGTRAVGTYIPAVNEDGTNNPVVSKVLSGETFYGRAYVVNAWYITAYEPIFDSDHKVVGILYSGVKEEAVKSLRNGILSTIVGENGYVSIFETKGKFVGQMLMHAEKIPGSENLYEYTDIDGNAVFTIIQEKALEADTKTAVHYDYTRNDGVDMLLSAIYFEEWDWVIFAITEKEDFMGPLVVINKVLLNTVMIVIFIGLIIVVVAVLLANRFASTITKPLNGVIDAANRMSEGEIDIDFTNNRKDEVGDLIHAFGQMVESLKLKVSLAESIANRDLTQKLPKISEHDVLGKALVKMSENLSSVLSNIQVSSEKVLVSTSQVSSSSNELSDGAVRSAAAIEEITSAVTEIDTELKKSVIRAQEAHVLSDVSSEAVSRGNEEMSSLQDAMKKIGESSKAISGILKLIDDIAFQTNLLALNAAVEAARAGQHGKGFAVVAEEVRNLAARSAAAAKQTGELISESSSTVDNGSHIAEKTASALNDISDQIEKNSELVQQIAQSSEEQSIAISLISEVLGQIDDVTQKNSTTAAETSSASMELSSEAKILQENITQFKLDAGYNQSHKMDDTTLQNIRPMKRSPRILLEDRPDKEWGSGNKSLPPQNSSLSDENFGNY